MDESGNKVKCFLPDTIEYTFEDEVYLKCDPEGGKGLITGITLRPSGHGYYVAWGNRQETYHYGFELTKEKFLVQNP